MSDSDDSFDAFEDSAADEGKGGDDRGRGQEVSGRVSGRATQAVSNQHFDEALEVSDASVGDFGAAALAGGSGGGGGAAGGSGPGEGGAGGSSGSGSGGGGSGALRERQLTNDRFDEVMEVSQSDTEESEEEDSEEEETDDEEENSDEGPGGRSDAAAARAAAQREQQEREQQQREAQLKQQQQQAMLQQQREAEAQAQQKARSAAATGGRSGPALGRRADDENDEDDEDDDEESSESGSGSESSTEGSEEDSTRLNIEGEYDPKDYEHLHVSHEIRELFHYIQRYKPHEVDLETTLKCFIPDYIPAVGEMDAFVKVPRPDAEADGLGKKVLDEPSARQSDATVLELQIIALSKKQHSDVKVHSIEDAAKNPAAIQRWIENITDMHRTKPPPQVHYKHTMPEVEQLMQEWPAGFEEALAKVPLPPPEIDLSLREYATMCCVLMDIPVRENVVESLHLLFTLYMDFKTNPHFMMMADGPVENAGGPGTMH